MTAGKVRLNFMKIIITIITLCFLTACSPGIRTGVVVSKEYEPERTWVQMMPIFVFNGNGGSRMIMVPFIHYDDEDWTIVVRGPNKKGQEDRQKFWITQQNYNRLNVGDIWNATETASHKDDITKKRKRG